MLLNNNRFGLLEVGRVARTYLPGFLVFLIPFLFSAQCFAQARVLDLSEVAPKEFATRRIESEKLILPPLPVTNLTFIETTSGVGIFDQSVSQSLAEETLFLPPTLEEAELQFATAEAAAEIQAEFLTDFPEQLAQVEDESLSQIAGDYVVLESASQPAEGVNQTGLSTSSTQCTASLTVPAGKKWIFWRSECQSRKAGPICCSIQKRTVNWRHSSSHLQGCIPEGYSLRCFIESIHSAEFHNSTLAENSPVDPGGSFADAKSIEGDETKPIQQVSINIAPPEGDLPDDRAEEKFEQLPMQVQVPRTHRLWNGTSFYWNASLLNHQPLYFEDVNLERHGFSRGYWQPLVSGAKFFGTLPALPYLMAADAPHETSFTLGQGRPGSHACYVRERPRLRLDATAVEAAAIVGLVFLIP